MASKDSDQIDKAGAYQKGREILTKSIEAVQKGDLASLQALLTENIAEQLNEISEGKNRKLVHFAAIFGHSHIIDWLVSNGAEVNVVDDDGNSISSLATYNDRKEALEWIIERFPDQLNHKNNKLMTLLHIATENCGLEIVRLLIGKGMDINLDSLNGTALELAVMWRKLEMAEFLLEQGADPNGSRGKYFPPALVMAASMNNRLAIELLLKFGADPQLTGSDHTTALEVACEFDFDFIDLLLEKGAILTGRNLKAAYMNKKQAVLNKFLPLTPVEENKMPVNKSAEAEEFKNKGNDEFHHNNYIGAVEFYSKAIELSPSSIYYSNRSQAYIFLSKYEDALADARMSRALDKYNVKALLREGQVFIALNLPLEAAGCYWAALKQDSNPSISTAFLSALDLINTL